MRRLAALLLLALPLAAEDKPPAPSSSEYTSQELGIRFAGVYGWNYEAAAGGGAWTDLAKYTEAAYNAQVRLQVRTNPYASLEAMRLGLQSEFAESKTAEPKPGAPVLREILFRDVQMKEGGKLPGIEVEAVALQVEADGKKREMKLLVRTYFGKSRLFRVHCSAGRARWAKVAELATRAAESLVVSAADERTAGGVEFQSARGGYRCIVPDGFRIVLPRHDASVDVRFEQPRDSLFVHVFSYFLQGEQEAHLNQLREFYGEALQVTSEEAKVLGGDGFLARVAKEGRITLIAGASREGRAVRVHAIAPQGKEAQAQALLDTFLRGFEMEAK